MIIFGISYHFAKLKVGERIYFTGFFLIPNRDYDNRDIDFIKETSLTEEGAINEPDFLFHFKSVSKLNP